MLRILVYILMSCMANSSYSQFSSLEDLETQCPNCSSSDLVDSLLKRAKQFDIEKSDSSFYFVERAENIILNARGEIDEKKPAVWMAYVSYHRKLKQKDRVEFYLKRLLNFYLEKNDPDNSVVVYSDLASHYAAIPDYASAFECYQKGLKISEDNDLLSKSIQMLVGIGNIYAYQAEYEQAIEIYKQVKERQKQEDFNTSHLTVLNNIAACYGYLKEYEQSIEELKNALHLSIESNDSSSIALMYGNIGGIYVEIEEFELAKENLEKAIQINKALKRVTHLTGNYLNLALVLKMNGEYEKAIESLEKVAVESDNQGDKVTLIEAYKELHNIYAETHQFKKAYEALVKYEELKFKIFNQNQSDKIATIKAGFEVEKREKEIEILKKKEELNEEQIARGRLVTTASLIGVLLSLVLIFVLIWSIRRKNKSNDLIQSKNSELAKKNNEIIDSINYAKRLQNAILPPLKVFKKHLKESFVFYVPKDIVAGDFYFFDTLYEENKKYVFYAAADCTGHGVPGAMVSIVGANGLKRCIQEFGLKNPGEILDRLASLVADHFSQSEERIRDGMDIALCCIEYDTSRVENEKPILLHYAGANNPLWILNPNRESAPKGSIPFKQKGGFEIKADKQAIGYTEKLKPFTTHTVQVETGDVFYTFSDGFADQFGGKNGKKYKSASFKRLLCDIYSKKMDEQHQIIKEEFYSWKNNEDQVDDVCVIGVRL